VPLVLRGLLYLKVEVSMKKGCKLMIDYSEDKDDSSEVEMDRVWLDTGDIVVELPEELLPYLEDADVLGIA
jgi:hypothetical protein